ncbi:MAG: hypothetical protein LBB22_03765 [Treponema sp.]|jgi:uncharacterized membrane protein YjdF|nr:hypothetical protein [Treponema sp.]
MKKDKSRIRAIVTTIVFFSLIVSTVYAITGIILKSINKTPAAVFFSHQRDYGLILLQCIFGIIVLFLPGLLEKRCKIVIENFIYIFFVVFLYAAIILGDVHDFYYKVPHWDTMLHACSGIMLGAIGISAIDILNNSKKIKINLSEGFMVIFAFFFSLSLGVLWEIYEFSVDAIFGFNMQKYRLENGNQLPGQTALYDTMKDLIVDALGAFAICLIGYVMLKNKNKHVIKLINPANKRHLNELRRLNRRQARLQARLPANDNTNIPVKNFSISVLRTLYKHGILRRRR